MSNKNRDPGCIYGRIRIGDEVFSGVIADRKATENIIHAFDRPSSPPDNANKNKTGDTAGR